MEIVSYDTALAQLTSESALLVRSWDVLRRWNAQTDLTPLLSGPDSADADERRRWRSMNVLGQVVNVVRENFHAAKFNNNNNRGSASSPSSPFSPAYSVSANAVTTHVRIPAIYKSGVTIFALKESRAHETLTSCPDLTFKESASERNNQ